MEENEITIITPRHNDMSPPQPRESPNKFTKFQKFLHKKKINFYKPPPPPPTGLKTLVLDLDETLIHSSQFPPHPTVKYFILKDDSIRIDVDDYDDNPEENQPIFVYMRPGLEEFINYAISNFEVFIYTYAERQYAEPILDYILPDLDENHRLYRDSCITATKTSMSNYYTSASKAQLKISSEDNKKFKLSKTKMNGKNGIIKDLVMLDRNMNEVIFVDDNDYQALKVNNNNTIVIPTWKGIPNDVALTSWLIPILNNCKASKDVREVISNISQKVRRFTL